MTKLADIFAEQNKIFNKSQEQLTAIAKQVDTLCKSQVGGLTKIADQLASINQELINIKKDCCPQKEDDGKDAKKQGQLISSVKGEKP